MFLCVFLSEGDIALFFVDSTLTCLTCQLASMAVKISVSKDWVVVICARDKGPLSLSLTLSLPHSHTSPPDSLASLNSLMRRIDLTCDILSPIAFSLFLFYLGTSAAIIFVVSWNSISFIPEYLILREVYQIVPSLSQKGWEQAAGEEKGEEEEGDRAIDKKEGEIGITRKGGKGQEEEEVRGGRRGVDSRFVLDMIHLFIFRYFSHNLSLSLSLSLTGLRPSV